jgi:hypothetical protein
MCRRPPVEAILPGGAAGAFSYESLCPRLRAPNPPKLSNATWRLSRGAVVILGSRDLEPRAWTRLNVPVRIHRVVASATELGETELRQPSGGAAQAPTETLSGVLERVTYHNAESGFCVLRVKARGQRDLVVVTGHAAVISATGIWINDRDHGLQFKAIKQVDRMLSNTGSMLGYQMAQPHLIRGRRHGEAAAQDMIDHVEASKHSRNAGKAWRMPRTVRGGGAGGGGADPTDRLPGVIRSAYCVDR